MAWHDLRLFHGRRYRLIRIATVALLGAEGALLLVALPLLMFLGGWAGADSGGIL